MKKFLPFLILFLLVGIFFRQFFTSNLLPIPADNIIGLYNPFRDLYAKDYPRGIPYKNFLISDPVEQEYPWRNLAISLEKQIQLPLWNPYSFAGMPLLANLQSGVFYPFNFFFLFTPFPVAWTLLILLQPLLAGTFMYLYLRNLKLTHIASLFGGFVFSFSGFSIMWLEWGTIYQTGLWLPLTLLAVDKINESKNKKRSLLWSGIFVFSFISAFFAGHLQTFFYLAVVAMCYIIVRLSGQKDLLRKLGIYVLLAILTVILTAVQWIPLLHLIALSARDVDHVSYTTAGWFIPWQHLIQFFAPDFFGNPTTLNYWGVWNYGELTGYVGLIPLFFALISFFVRSKKVYFFGALLLIALLFALPTPLSILPFTLNIPFLSTAQPTRLLYVIDFCLAVLAAIGLSSIQKFSKTVWVVMAGFLIVITGLWGFVYVGKFGVSATNLAVAKQNLFLPTVLMVVLIGSVIIHFLFRNKKYTTLIVSSVLFLLTIFDLFRFGYKFTPFNPATYLYPSTQTLHFLKTNIGNYRIMETDRQIFAPNFSVMYRLQSIDGYDPLYLKRYGEFIAASERGRPDITSPFGFNRIITPENYKSQFVNLLGVKYILSLVPLESSNLKKVFQEGQTIVYENKTVLPRAFFVKNIISSSSKQDTINLLFKNEFHLLTTAVVENRPITNSISFSEGNAVIESYSPNRVVIKTENHHEGFLVLTDVDYPTWHVAIDGKQSKIFLTDYTFRGVDIPKGKHEVVFSDSLF